MCIDEEQMQERIRIDREKSAKRLEEIGRELKSGQLNLCYQIINNPNHNFGFPSCGTCIRYNGVDYCGRDKTRVEELKSWGCYYPCDDAAPHQMSLFDEEEK